MVTTFDEAIKWGAEKLKNKVENPIREARLLLSFVLQVAINQVISNGQKEIAEDRVQNYQAAVRKREKGMPFAYITGEKEFMGLNFYVTPDVLIPRPDTEILVNTALYEGKSILDLCTGSGCVAIALATLMRDASVTGVDISEKALAVAEKNARRHDVQVQFIQKDILNDSLEFAEKFDTVIANPPYIRKKDLETLESEVKEFEPLEALDGGADGLIFYRRIIDISDDILKPGGFLCFEVGYDQANDVALMMGGKFDKVELKKDYAGINRVVCGRLKGSLQERGTVHDGHRQRFRKRFIEEGLDHFEAHEILELLLYYAIPRKDINLISHQLIDTFGSLSAVFDASVDELVRYGKITENTAVLLSMVPQLGRAYHIDKWRERPVLTNTYQAGDYVKSLFFGRIYEAFMLVCLDAQRCVIRSEIICEGTVDETPVYPRLAVEIALKNKAKMVIIAHNHPSGSLQPSGDDIEATKKIVSVLENIDISVVDHIIVGGDNFLSMAERGYMNN